MAKKKPKIKSPYRKGYLKELEVKRILRKSGKFYTVFRSAGSHSPFDLIAISNSKVLLLQVKTGKFNFKKELKKLKSIETPECVEKQLWVLNKEWKIVEI
jgi:Holliday junction resolvase